jgi:zeaxanthin glucosyltransferase
MATFVFLPFHWAANMNATFALARRLRERGHCVIYLGIPDSEERIQSQGFDFLPIFERAFPRGTLADQQANEASGRAAGLAGFRDRVLAVIELLEQGEIERALGSVRPDLFVVASATPWVGIGAWKTGVPVIAYSSSLVSTWDPAVPPLQTALTPGRGMLPRLRNRLAWRGLFLLQQLVIPLRYKIFDDVKGFARRSGYPLDAIDFAGETWPALHLPTLVFCPPDFDFPRQRLAAGAVFVEPSVDIERRDPDFPWERLQEDRPLIYCALGSVAPSKYVRQITPFFQAFLDAMAERPHWQGLLATGRHVDAGALRCPANVVMVPEAPQLRILARAALMVSHGGFSSVKECVFFGVPMVVLPMFYDQPGNAARVVHHGLGVRGRFGVDPAKLGRWMDTVMGDPAYRDRVRRMSQILRDWEARSPGVELAERIAAAARLEVSGD